MTKESDGVDRGALATLRPGMSTAALEAALGPRWRPPAPHQEGAVDIVRKTHGFRARVDAAGRLGEVAYDYRFDPRVSIDGLRLGMTAEEVVQARPDLALPPEQNGWRIGSMTLSGGVRWAVTVTLGTVNGIAFRNPAAVYPEKRLSTIRLLPAFPARRSMTRTSSSPSCPPCSTPGRSTSTRRRRW